MFFFRKLFEKKIVWHATKLRFCKLPKEVIIEECRSVEYRALYFYAIKNDIKVKFHGEILPLICIQKMNLKIIKT